MVRIIAVVSILLMIPAITQADTDTPTVADRFANYHLVPDGIRVGGLVANAFVPGLGSFLMGDTVSGWVSTVGFWGSGLLAFTGFVILVNNSEDFVFSREGGISATPALGQDAIFGVGAVMSTVFTLAAFAFYIPGLINPLFYQPDTSPPLAFEPVVRATAIPSVAGFGGGTDFTAGGSLTLKF